MTEPHECRQVRLAAMALGDGESAPLDASQIDSHLQTCDACREEIAWLDPSSLFPPGAKRAAAAGSLLPAIQRRIEEDPSIVSKESQETEESQETQISSSASPRVSRQNRSWWIAAALGAAACLLFMGWYFLAERRGDRGVAGRQGVGPAEIWARRKASTTAQKISRNQLEDGTLVIADQGTIYSSKGRRRIRLQQGQVYLIVARSSKPFIVETDNGQVTARGTRLVVAAEQETLVAVAQGQVTLSGRRGRVRLGAGQQGILNREGKPMRQPAPRLSHLVSWAKEALAQQHRLVEKRDSENGLLAVDPWGQQTRLTLRKYHVDVLIEDGIARTTIDQTFFNHYPWNSEGTFHFPLPPDASVSRLAMYVGGKLNEGGMVERGRGQEIYNDILYQRRDPALLEMMEGNVFKMRIFPLEGRQEKRIFLSYTQNLEELYGTMRYWFPMDHTHSIAKRLSIRVRVRQGAKAFEPRSSTHDLSTRIEGDDLVLEYDTQDAKPDQDFLLRLLPRQSPHGSRVATCDKDGFQFVFGRFLPEIPGAVVARSRQWIVLNDVSASRSSIEAKAQRYIFQRLLSEADDDDSVFLIDVNTRAQRISKRLVPVRSAGAKRLLKHRAAARLGATNLRAGIEAAAKLIAEQRLQNSHILYLGDGVATDGRTEVFDLVRAIPQGATFVGVGVGKKVDSLFLQAAADRTGGMFTTINPDEDIDWRVFDMVAALNTPRLTKITVALVDAAGKPIQAIAYPSSRSLADGETLTVVARCQDQSPAKIVFQGSLGAKKFRSEAALVDAAAGAEYIPRLWAKRHIDELARSDMGREKEMIELSKQYYVVTPLTSLIVLEDDAMYEEYQVQRGRKDHWALYPAPTQIDVVREPVDWSDWGGYGYAAGEDGKVQAQTEPKSVRQIVDSIQLRVNAPFYYWRPQPHGQGRLALYQLLDGQNDPTRLLTYWYLLAAGAEDAAQEVWSRQSATTETSAPTAPQTGQASRELLSQLVIDQETNDYLQLGLPSVSQTAGASGSYFFRPPRSGMIGGGGFGGVFGGFLVPPIRADGEALTALLPSDLADLDMDDELSVELAELPMLGLLDRRRKLIPTLALGGSAVQLGNVPLSGLQPDLLKSFQAELSRRRERINGDIRQFNHQYGYWDGFWEDGWANGRRSSIDLTQWGDAGWFQGLGLKGLADLISGEGIGGDQQLGQRSLLPILDETAGDRQRPMTQMFFKQAQNQKSQRIAMAWVGAYGQSLNTQPGTCAVLAADYLLARQRALASGETGPAEKKEQEAIQRAIAELPAASARLENTEPFWGYQGWNYRPQPWTFQPPTVQVYLNYSWSYDLTRYATGLYSNSFDMLDEVLSQFGRQGEGQIDDAARRQINSARDAIRPAKIRYTDKGPQVFIASGDRFSVTWRNEMYLEEQMVCDGQQVLHLYEELGLVARRQATPLRRAVLRRFVPHLVEPVESLAKRFHVELVREDGQGFTLQLSSIQQAKDAASTAKLLVHVLSDGRIREKHLMAGSETQLRLTFDYSEGKVTARWLDQDDQQLAHLAYDWEPLAEGVDPFQVDLSDKVVLDMPLRKPSYYAQRLQSLGEADSPAKVDLHRHHGLALIQELNWRRWGGVNEAARESFTQATQLLERLDQPAKLGDLTLLGSTGDYGVLKQFQQHAAVEPSHPLVRFYQMRHGDWADARENLKDHLDGLLGHLAIYQACVHQHQQTATYEFFAQTYPDSPLLLAATHHLVHAANRPQLWRQLYDHPKWQRLAMLMSTQHLHDESARERFAADFVRLNERLSKRGAPLPLTVPIAQVLKQHAAEGVWRELTEKRLQRVKNSPAVSPLLLFAEQAMSWGEAQLADEALTLARERLSGRNSLLGRFALAQADWAGGRFDDALKLCDEVLTKLEANKIVASPALLAAAARLAQQAGQTARAIDLEERALAAEHPHLPELINLQGFRQRYNWLWQQYQAKLAEAVQAADQAAVRQWTARTEAAWHRWYEVDPQNSTMASQMATLQMMAGNSEQAWQYLSTVIDHRPREAESHQTVAQWYRQRGELEQAQQWLARAYQWDTANPRWLFERAQVLDELGRHGEADQAYRQVIGGSWAPGLQNYVDQARSQLSN